ncbi:MAG: protein phosphatase 2C domain-containing protein [Bradymonadales bacterium]|nr:protein phosphatase 2C domain-containing protein [Bradymonadales bacterium]
METKTPHPLKAATSPVDALPVSLQPGEELTWDGQIYRVVVEEPATSAERRYQVCSAEEPDRLLWLRHRLTVEPECGFSEELACLQRLHEEHPFYLVPRVIGHQSGPNDEMLLMERSFGSTLGERFGELSDKVLLALCLEQVLLAVSKVHQVGYVITDLSPDSFVWPETGLIQLVELTHITPLGSPPIGYLPCPYQAPELTADTPVDELHDIFALGVIFAPVLLGRELAEGTDYLALARECDLVEPVVSQLICGALADRSRRFDSVEEMRTLVYQLKNEQVCISRPIAASASTVGVCRHRYINEDSAGYQELCFQYQSRPYYLGFFCVADGMGGHEQGERASQLAVLGALQAFRQLIQGFSLDFIVDKLPSVALTIGRFASEVVTAGATQVGNTIPRMGTTFTGILVVNDEIGLVHVGDSRALLIREGELTQLSLDHSLVAALVRVGQLDDDEAEGLNGRNILIRCIDATAPMFESDFDGLAAIGQKEGRMKIHSGDRIVLITDGVWGALNAESLRTLAAHGSQPQEIADRIVRAAIEAGGDDNATALVVMWQ